MPHVCPRQTLGRNLLPRVRETGALLCQVLEGRLGQHPNICEIPGRGLLLALKFVADRATKAIFEPARALAARIKAAGLDAGLICDPMGGTIDGWQDDHVFFAPPCILSRDQVGELTDKLALAIGGAPTNRTKEGPKCARQSWSPRMARAAPWPITRPCR